MKHFFVILLLTITFGAFAGGNGTYYPYIAYRMDYYDSATKVWRASDSSFYGINNQNLGTLHLRYRNRPAGWEFSLRITRQYDTNGGCTSYLHEGPDYMCNCFRAYDRQTNTFNAVGGMTSLLDEYLDTATGNWIQTQKVMVGYDAQYRMTDWLNLAKNDSTQGWDSLFWQTDFIYDANDSLLSTTFIGRDSGKWVIYGRTLHRYNATYTADTILGQSWDGSNWSPEDIGGLILRYDNGLDSTVWQFMDMGNGSKPYNGRTYYYNADDSLIYATYAEYDINGQPEDHARGYYTYDLAGNRTEKLVLQYDPYNGGMDSVTRTVTVYNNENNPVYEVVIDLASGADSASRKYFYYYTQNVNAVSVSEIDNVRNLSVFPNPAQGVATVTFNAVKQGNVNVRVYNAQGQLLINQVSYVVSGQNNLQLPTGSLSTGNYFIHVHDVSGAGKPQVLSLMKE